ncbi:MAG: hypothetical protein HQK98_05990 [Nitrospirae bacterium]|nr:hypothetical protein [Nitrospirota bacterium]
MRKAVHTAILVLLLPAVAPTLWAATQEASFTQQDRERLIRLEVRIEEGFKSIDKRIEDGAISTNKRIDDTNKRIDDGVASINKRIDDANQQMGLTHNSIFVVIALIVGLYALIYKQKSEIVNVVRKIKKIEEREEKIERALKELALRDPNAAEANKRAGLL